MRRIGIAAFVSFAVIPVAIAQAPSSQPDAAVERVMRAGAEAMHANRVADAETSFREATRLAPQFPSAFLDLGLAQLREGKLDAAEDSVGTACQLDPKLPGAHMFLGVVNYQMHRLDKAREALKSEIALNDQNAEAQMWLGVVELADGHPERAVPPLDRAAELTPNDLNVLDYRARAHTLVARASYDTMYRLAPDSWQVHRALGESYVESGRTAEAIAEYQTAVAMQPQNSDLYEALGNAYQKVSKFAEAKQAYEQELRLSPHNAVALYNLGKIDIENQEDPKAGVFLLEEVIKIYPHSAPAAFYLGLGLVKQGRDQDAIPYLEKVAQDQSTGEMPKRAAYELARAYRRLGRPEDSRRALAQFEKLKNADEQQEAQQNALRSKLLELDKTRALQSSATPNAPE
ncbi:MAG TPA: tetratricopeptide repeat protein [Acidobacteriaceae bacterium]|jgi:tetratricopeptide (TPR) repeat protein